MKRKYSSIRRAFIELDRVKGCFFRRSKRKAKKLNSTGAFAFGSSYAGTYLLDKHSRRKVNLYLRTFFFFKLYYCNLFNFNPGFIGEFYHTREGTFFLNHFFFFNNFLEVPSFFENAGEEEAPKLTDHLTLECATQTVERGLVNFNWGLGPSKPEFLEIFFRLLSLKRKTNRLGILFFLIFCLLRA